MAYTPSFIAKLRLNGVAYAFTRVRYSLKNDNLRTTNSEGEGGAPIGGVVVAGAHTNVPGNSVVEVTVTAASFDPENNPFNAPIFLQMGLYMTLIYLPDGNLARALNIPSFKVIDVDGDADINGLQPIDFRGESNGWFTLPSG